MKTADGRDVKIGFDTMSASLFPVRNAAPALGGRLFRFFEQKLDQRG
jgi:hypothetical protein